MRRLKAGRLVPVVLLCLSIVLLISSGPVAAVLRWRRTAPSPLTAPYHRVTYGEGLFVAVGDGGMIATSLDGVTWEPRDSGTYAHLHDVMWNDGRFLAFGGDENEGVVVTSPDGVAWSQVTTVDGALMGAAYGNGRYVAVSINHTYFTSTDGETWSRHTMERHTAMDGWMAQVVFGGDRFVAISSDGMYSSTDGEHWSLFQTPGGYRIAYGGGKFIAARRSGDVFLSTDGRSWTERRGAIDYVVEYMSHANGQFFAGAGDHVYRSSDGVTWTTLPNMSGSDVADIASGNGTYVAVGSDGGIVRSSDALTWTRQNPVADARDPLHVVDVVRVGGQYYAVGEEGQNHPKIFRSTDAQTWTPIFTPDAGLNRIIYARDRFVAIGEKGLIYSSSDGSTWAKQLTNANIQWNAVTDVDGRFVVVGGQSFPEASAFSAVSADGIAWEVIRQPSITASLDHVIYAGGRFVASLSWGGAAYSADGRQWVKAQMESFPHSMVGIVYADGRFLAITHGRECHGAGYEENCDDAKIFTSGDGTSWTRTGQLTNQYVVDLTYGDGEYKVVTTHGAILSSRNGYEWSRQPLITGWPSRVLFLGTEFLVTAGSGTVIRGELSCGGFFDVAKSDPACGPIQQLRSKQVLAGYPDGTFQSHWTITRAEFVKVMVVAMGWQPQPGTPSPFPDVQPHWVHTMGFLQPAVARGAVGGVDGKFLPQGKVRRAEAIKMAVTATGLKLTGAPPAPYADLAGRWFEPWVGAAHQAGIIGTKAANPLFTESALDGDRYLTRAEATLLMTNVMNATR